MEFYHEAYERKESETDSKNMIAEHLRKKKPFYYSLM